MMKFQRLKRYRHIHTLDMDIVVIKIPAEDEHSISLNVAYYSRHSKKFFDVPREDVVIKKEDFHKWMEVPDGTS